MFASSRKFQRMLELHPKLTKMNPRERSSIQCQLS